MGNKILVCITTTNLEKEANKIAETLISEKLAACISITNANSFYNWKNELVNDSEFLLIIKTITDKKQLLENKIKEIHNYSLPEILFFEVETSKEYFLWVKGEVNE